MVLFVTNNEDSKDGSLRHCFRLANVSMTPTIIVIDKSVQNIKLLSEIQVKTSIKLINHSEDLSITSKTSRIFHVEDPCKSFKIVSRKGKLHLSGRDTLGGAIYVPSTNNLTKLKDVKISRCHSTSGGGIYTLGELLCINSHFTHNIAVSQGGAIWAQKNTTLINSRVYDNLVSSNESTSCGGGIYVDDGNLTIDETKVNGNIVAYKKESLGNGRGSAGGIFVAAGNLYIQNHSQVNHNLAYNSAGVEMGIGNIFMTNKSRIDGNQSFNTSDANGGGGITITKGTVFVSRSSISDNKTVGMYSGGIVSLIGDVIVTDRSKLNNNSNAGPGGAIAVNVGTVSVDKESQICENTASSLGGAIVTFTPSPGFLNISGHSKILKNTLNNRQTIGQTIKAFIRVVVQHLADQQAQTDLHKTSGGQKLIGELPAIKKHLQDLHEKLQQLPINNTIGGAITSLLTANINIVDSCVEDNFCGQNVSEENSPFKALGGGIFGYLAPINIQKSLIVDNGCLTDGGGIWSGAGVNITDSEIDKNRCKNKGGGVYLDKDSQLTLIRSGINNNHAREGGGVYTALPVIKNKSEITNNSSDNVEFNF